MCPMKPTSVQRLRNSSRGQEINEAALSLARRPVLHKNSLSSYSPSRADSCAQTRTRAHSLWLRTPTKSHLVLLCLPCPNHQGWGVERLTSWILIGREHGGRGRSPRGVLAAGGSYGHLGRHTQWNSHNSNNCSNKIVTSSYPVFTMY